METPTSNLSYLHRNRCWFRALDTWYDIDYGNGIFAMVGGSTSHSIYDNGAGNKLATSTDGTNWTTKTIDGTWRSIAYGNGVWVLVGNGIATSTDNGATWTTRTLGTDYWYGSLNAVAYGNGRFVAVGAARNGGGSDIVTSTDGIRWVTQTKRGMEWATQTNMEWRECERWDYWRNIAYGNGRWVAVSRYGSIATSTDGFNWSIRTKVFAEKTNLVNVAYEDGLWVIIGEAFDNIIAPDQIAFGKNASDKYRLIFNTVISTDNGATWTTKTDRASRHRKAYGNGLWVSVCNYADVLYSLGRCNYRDDVYPFEAYAIAPVYRYGGCDGYNIATSPDGIAWTKQTVGTCELRETMHRSGNGRYITK
jgi:hypothetical protein